MEKKKDEHPAVVFLKFLYQYCDPHDFINIRLFYKNDRAKIVHKFIPLSEIESIPKMLKSYTEQYQCYFGVATRIDGDGTKDGIIQIPCLWVDIDFKDIPEEEALRRLKDFPLKPSFIIRSGGGFHVYWMFKEPASKEEILCVEDLNKRLASYLNGDSGSTDASHLLRIPGTLNHKYTPPREVTIEEFNPEREYNLGDFDSLPEVEAINGKEKPRLSEGWEKELLKGVPEGERNTSIVRLAGRYLGKGLSRDETLPILLNVNSRFTPPLDVEEVEACLNSISKTHQRNASDNQQDYSDLKIETLGDLLKKDLPPRDIIMGDGLIARKDLVIFSGPQKKGKSLASLNLAISIARQTSWLGFDIPLLRRIGIIQQEIPEESLKDRLEKMVKNIDGRNFLERIPHLTCRALKLDSKEGIEKIYRWLDVAKVDLLIIDPLYLFHNKRENDTGDMGRVCEIIQTIAEKYDCGIVIIHHHGKPSQVEREGGDLHRGSSVLRDATDANWTFTRVPQNKYQLSDLPSRYALFSFEQRHILAPDPILIRLNPETLWFEQIEIKSREEIKIEEVIKCLHEHGGEMLQEDLILTLVNKLKVREWACRQGIYKARDESKIIASKGEGRGRKRTWKLEEGVATN